MSGKSLLMSGKSQRSVWEILTIEIVWENRIGQKNTFFKFFEKISRIKIFLPPVQMGCHFDVKIPKLLGTTRNDEYFFKGTIDIRNIYSEPKIYTFMFGKFNFGTSCINKAQMFRI